MDELITETIITVTQEYLHDDTVSYIGDTMIRNFKCGARIKYLIPEVDKQQTDSSVSSTTFICCTAQVLLSMSS